MGEKFRVQQYQQTCFVNTFPFQRTTNDKTEPTEQEVRSRHFKKEPTLATYSHGHARPCDTP